MSAPICDNEALRSMVGFLVLGRLTGAERDAVNAHLRACPACRTERDEVNTVVSLLGLLSDEDVRDLIAEYGTPDGKGAPSAHRVVHRFGRSLRPGGRARPASARRKRRKGALLALAGVAAVTLSTLLLLGPWSASGGLGPVVAVAATRDDLSGMDMSVTVYAERGKVSVRLHANNLPPGAHRVYAVTAAGEDLLLGRLTGQNTFAGTVPVDVDRLGAFQLRNTQGEVLVEAGVTKGSPGR